MAYLPRQKFLFAPDDWDTGYRAALRGSATAPVNLAVLGDSFSHGSPAVTDFTNLIWWPRFRSGLLAKYSQGADFWQITQCNAFFAQGGNTYNGTPPFTSVNTSNVALFYGFGFGAMAWWSPNPAGTLWTFTTPYACTDIDILTIDWFTGSWIYTVDGGADQTVTIATAPSPNNLRRTAITGLANTTHTIICKSQSGGNVHAIMGCIAWKSKTVGLRFAWCAAAGAYVASFTGAGQTALPDWSHSLIWQGKSGSTETGFGFPAVPDLAIIALGINDCTGFGQAPEGYQGGLRRICQAFRRGNPNCSILFMANSNPDGDSSDVTTSFANSIQWPLYIDRMMNIAIDYNAALVNFHAKWGETGVNQGFQLATDPHPTDNGHADINTTLSALL